MKRLLAPLVPERRLAALVAVAALLWLLPAPTGPRVALGALGLLAVILFVDYLLLPVRDALTLARETPPGVGLGDVVEGTYVIGNRTGRAVELVLEDRFPPQVQGGVHAVRVRVAAHSEARVPFDVRGMARALVPFGPFGARVTSGLGLLGQRRRLVPDDAIRVNPSMSGVRHLRLLAMQHHLERAGLRSLRRKGEGQGFDRLREYAPGDDPRHIDWKASAKKSKLITREFTIERSQTVITLIDAGRSMTQLAGEWPRFEHALSSALVLTDIAANAGDRVGTLVFDDAIRAFVPAQQSRSALQSVRDAFVPVTASSREPDYASAFRFLATHQRKRALVVFFTDVLGVRASRALLAHVARSASRHLALVVALRNDEVLASATPGATGTTATLYERAAAEELIESREEALELMRRAGAVVLDVSPGAMTASVVNRYLELKGRGAL